jgi:NADH-quinone oxidoreductase subunit H
MPDAADIQNWVYQNIPPWVAIAVIFHLTILGACAYLILLERKIASWVQDRLGPNRVGLGFGIIPVLKDFHFWGLGQPLADGLKFILKEDYRPAGTDKNLFSLAPVIMMTVIIVSICALPLGGVKGNVATVTVPAKSSVEETVRPTLPTWWYEVINARTTNNGKITEINPAAKLDVPTKVDYTYGWRFQIANLNIGVLGILAILSLAVYGVVIGGWASNNKYSFLGGLRATCNMISYEVPLGLSVLAICIMYGTLDLQTIVDKQAFYWKGVIPAWNIFTQPLAFWMFLICIHAEANRAPFDLAECEQELVGGYHTEYSSMRFALFFLAEYAGMITTSAICVALFFGGWHFPGIDTLGAKLFGAAFPDPTSTSVTDSLLLCIVRACVFFGKTVVIIAVFMWVRWSLPRFRFDQLMGLAWRGLIPISLVLLMGTACVVWWYDVSRAKAGLDPRAFSRVPGKMALALLGMNLVALIIFLVAKKLMPAPTYTNVKMPVSGSRFIRTPLPGVA